MPEKSLLRRSPFTPTFFFSAVVCAIFVNLTDDLFFSLLSGGKALDGRNLILQSTFIFFYFACLFLFIAFFLHRPLNYILSNPFPMVCLSLIVPLAAHAYVGSFSRFVADDFSSAALVVRKGIIGATWDWYINWSGRFSASFFDSLAGYLGPSSMKYAVLISLVLLLAGMVFFARKVVRGPNRWKTYCGLFLSSLALVSSFFITPDLPQSLYWGQGMRSLILPLIPLFFILTILLSIDTVQKRSFRIVGLFIIGLLSFIAGGFGETYVVIQTTIFGFSFLQRLFTKPFGFFKRDLWASLIALFFSIAAMVVMILAPGNRVRQTYFPAPPSLNDLAKIAFVSLNSFFDSIFRSPESVTLLTFMILLTFIIGCLYAVSQKFSDSQHNEPHSSPLCPGIPFFISSLCSFALLLYVSFLPSAYAMSTTPPPRTLILPSLILCVSLITLSFAAGIKFGPVLISRNVFLFLQNGWFSLLAIGIMAVFSFHVTSRILAVVPDYRFFADRFDRADQMIREAVSAGETTVTVPEVHNHFGLSDYGEGTTYWLDDAVDTYYGIHVIINKHMK